MRGTGLTSVLVVWARHLSLIVVLMMSISTVMITCNVLIASRCWMMFEIQVTACVAVIARVMVVAGASGDSCVRSRGLKVGLERVVQ